MSSSSSNHQWLYVFINFNGENTHPSFVSHLYDALSNAGIKAFIEDGSLEKGDEVHQLVQAVKLSRISLVVLTTNYALSTWCLDELIRIMETRKNYGQVVIPIFYHVIPSDVRDQKGHFALGGAGFKRDVRRWSAALHEVASLSGFELSTDRSEAEAINAIVNQVFQNFPSANVEMKPSPEVNLQPTTNEEMESSPKALQYGSNTTYLLMYSCKHSL
ncbi:TMV resistance protein N-like [Lotus japonicus]|uniref:TMV resistance protein N-like n=1 Tax=Lotus japonicus TaxID=34305 RepID=UPI00258F5D09|nr:TMV resistance protein N-like [Lotus japonicus]XP_057458271.1 TMV resistance protein N-like [Lotus japonicus]